MATRTFCSYVVQFARRELFPVGSMSGPHRTGAKRGRDVECAFHEDREHYSVRSAGADTWNEVPFEICDNPGQRFPALKQEDRTARAEGGRGTP